FLQEPPQRSKQVFQPFLRVAVVAIRGRNTHALRLLLIIMVRQIAQTRTELAVWHVRLPARQLDHDLSHVRSHCSFFHSCLAPKAKTEPGTRLKPSGIPSVDSIQQRLRTKTYEAWENHAPGTFLLMRRR